MKAKTKYFNYLPMNMRLFESDFWMGVFATLGGWLSYFVLPIQSFIWLMVALVFFDSITGVMAAKKRGEDITAAKLWRTGAKLTAYMIGFLACRGIEVVYSIPMPYIFSVPVVIAEFKSNIENIEEVTGVMIWSLIRDALPAIKKK